MGAFTRVGGKGIIVLGVNRSGTSAVAAALKELGVYFGKEADLPSLGRKLDYDSHENRHLVSIGSTVLSELEKGGLAARSMPPDWREYANLDEHVLRSTEFLADYFGGHELWGWKDPQSSLLIPFFECIFEKLEIRPTYLMPIRHPLEVATGIFKRQGLPILEGIGCWVQYTLTALATADRERIFLLPYREFIAEPRPILAPILETLGIPAPSEDAWASVRQAVRPSLDRTHVSDDNLPSIAKKVWQLLSAIAIQGRIAAGSR